MKPNFLALTGLLAVAALANADDNADYRLPAGVAPVSQDIELRLDPSRSDYTGQTTIRLTVAAETDRIGLHQIGLDMTDIVLRATARAAS